MFKRSKDSKQDPTLSKKISEYQIDNPYKYGIKYYNDVEKHSLNYDAEAASEQVAIDNQRKVVENYKNQLRNDISEIDAELRDLR